ncbi:MAG: hypothetical protein QM661_07640 [Solimonas sp.]
MQRPWWSPLLLLAAMLAGGAARAQTPSLTADALRACATQVQQLRGGAVRLNAQVAQADARRRELDAQAAALRREADGAPHDLQAGLDLQQRRRQHADAATAFNRQMAAQRQAIDDLDRVKADYERNCAARRYRRSDFAALPADARAAMRAGLDDIRVPYVDPAPYLEGNP